MAGACLAGQWLSGGQCVQWCAGLCKKVSLNGCILPKESLAGRGCLYTVDQSCAIISLLDHQRVQQAGGQQQQEPTLHAAGQLANQAAGP